MDEVTTVRDIVKRIEEFAPKYLAEDWDPIGLSFGSLHKEVKKVMVALDFDADTLQEAKKKEVDLLLTHHPAIFGKLTTLNEEDERRKEYVELIRSDIALYSAHTNIDAAKGGMNDWLADAIGLPKERDVVEVTYKESYKKLVVYVPEHSAKEVRQAIHAAGAGEIGNYTEVSYNVKGSGRFTPQQGAHPAEGQVGKPKKVEEERIEMMFPDSLTPKVIQAVQDSHPYEEPVFDLYTLENGEGKTFGYGRVGDLEISTEDLAERLKNIFHLDGVRFVSSDPQKTNHRVAIFGGSGGKYYPSALSKQADIFITGDVSYHAAQDMLRDGLDVIDPGHYIEHIFVEKMVEIVKEWIEEEQWTVDVLAANSQTDLFRFK